MLSDQPQNGIAGLFDGVLALRHVGELDMRKRRAKMRAKADLSIFVTAERIVAEDDAHLGRSILEGVAHEQGRGAPGAGLLWTPDRLWARLAKPGAGYALHAGPHLLLVSAPRSDRRASHTLLCAFLARPGSAPRRRDVAAAVSAACRLHRRPLFVYAGINDALPLPGVLLPARLRPSPMILQLRDFDPAAAPLAPSRFEPLDFDFA